MQKFVQTALVLEKNVVHIYFSFNAYDIVALAESANVVLLYYLK